ncbi:MAG: hypothetical protein L7U59_05340 [Flavobacteriaceae bacterium]|nr:hypothetical protein [Flavobacteriaceae bacterium]
MLKAISGIEVEPPEGKVLENHKSHFWMNDNRYQPFLEEWSKRPEYRSRIQRKIT